MEKIDVVDIQGNLETIRNLSDIGVILIDLGKLKLIPTILEILMEHIQRLALEYASVEG